MSEVSDGQPRPHGRAPQTRALWWLFGGVALLGLGVVAMAPELLGDLGGLSGLALLVVAAGLPGLAIMLWVAARRRSQPGGAWAPRQVEGPTDRRGA